MSELLRAILDKECLDTRTAIYTLFLQTLGASTGVVNFAEQRASLQLKTDTYFLCMAYARFAVASFDVGSDPSTDPFELAPVRLFDASSNKDFSQIPIQPALLNFHLNQCQSLSEYILFKPRQLIVATIGVQITDQALAENHRTFLVLSGVEYQMPG